MLTAKIIPRNVRIPNTHSRRKTLVKIENLNSGRMCTQKSFLISLFTIAAFSFSYSGSNALPTNLESLDKSQLRNTRIYFRMPSKICCQADSCYNFRYSYKPKQSLLSVRGGESETNQPQIYEELTNAALVWLKQHCTIPKICIIVAECFFAFHVCTLGMLTACE